MTFFQRAKATFEGLSPMVKSFMPGAFVSLILDMCKALDNLQEQRK